MFWPQGGPSSNIFTGRSIFGSGNHVLGQSETECEGDVCFVVASRLDPTKAKSVYDQMEFAYKNSRQCILDIPGGSDMFEQVGKKVKDTVQGITASAALTKEESDYLTRFQACVDPLMQDAEPKILGIPQTPLLIGAGALGLIGLIAAFARK